MATSVDSIQQKPDLVKDYVCGACVNIEERADYFCETCNKFFCEKRVKKHDLLYINHSKYGREEINKWPLTKEMEDLLLKCDAHNKKLKMYCEDHSQLCCSDCRFLNHKTCSNVAPISESIQKLSLDMQSLSINLKTTLDQLNMFMSKKAAIIQSVEVSCEENLQEIRDMRNKLNATLDKLETKTLEELDKIRTTLQTSLKTDVDYCSRLKDELQQLGEAVQSLSEKSKKEMEFIATTKCLAKLQESETYLKNAPLESVSSMKFQSDIDINEYLSKRSGLGKIVVMYPNQVLTVKRKFEYNVNTSIETDWSCFITGICSLPSDHVIVIDNKNKKVKLFDQQYKVISHCDLSGYPRGICQITSNEVAVTVGSDVQFISVGDGMLLNERRFQLPHRAVSIAYHHEALYITSGTALYHYTLTVFMCAVSPALDRIYVTNTNQHKLLTLSMDGTLISTFTDPDLREPWGVHVTTAGQVFVCGSSSNTVIQVNRQGREKLATLVSKKDGLSSPTSVCFNRNIDQITVGQNNNKIIVFELQ